MDIQSEIEKRRDQIIHLQQKLHQYPEIGLQEYKTSKRMKEELSSLMIPYKEIGETGITALIGSKPGKCVALRADMDALKITERSEVPFASKNEGLMHACGHDIHMASLIGAASFLKEHEQELDGQIKLIFQPSEENCKGARLMINGGALDGVDEIFGIHVFGDMDCGTINISPGPRMASTDNFKIEITGKAGHAAKPHQCVDSTVAAAAIVMGLQTVVSRECDPIEPAVLTIGRLVSGTQHNIIAGEAFMEGTMRTFSKDQSIRIKEHMQSIVEGTANAYGVQAKLSYSLASHPAVWNDENVVKTALSGALRCFCEDQLIPRPMIMLGEDFSLYQEKIPGAFAFLGGANEQLGCIYPNHHDRFQVDPQAIINGAKLYAAYAVEAVNKSTD